MKKCFCIFLLACLMIPFAFASLTVSKADYLYVGPGSFWDEHDLNVSSDSLVGLEIVNDYTSLVVTDNLSLSYFMKNFFVIAKAGHTVSLLSSDVFVLPSELIHVGFGLGLTSNLLPEYLPGNLSEHLSEHWSDVALEGDCGYLFINRNGIMEHGVFADFALTGQYKPHSYTGLTVSGYYTGSTFGISAGVIYRVGI